MRTWALLHQRPGDDHWVDTGDSIEADTVGRAAELLLPVELCRAERRWDALSIDFLANGPTIQFRANGGLYRIVPVASDDSLDELAERLEMDAAALIAQAEEMEG